MTELADVRDAIKTVLDAAAMPGLTVYAYPDGQANIPAVLVVPADADFDVAMGRGNDTWLFDLTVLVSESATPLAQRHLDSYVTGGGTTSIRKAIFGNRTLGLSNCDAHIAGMSGYNSQHTVGAATYYGAVLRLIAHIKPTS